MFQPWLPPFDIQLPTGARDLSTWIFALPGGPGASPTVVIRADLVSLVDVPAAHMQRSIDSLRSQVQRLHVFEQVHTPIQGWPAASVLLEFQLEGQPPVIQRQHYIMVAPSMKLFTVCCTAPVDIFPAMRPMFDQILASWQITASPSVSR